MHKNPITLSYPASRSKALKMMDMYSIRHIPIINDNGELVDLILWSDFLENGDISYPIKDIPVVIMAGGKGTRLDPFTKILPKPLIPIGEKPIIEIVMDCFRKYGFNKFILTLNYKAEMIKIYLADNPKYEIQFIEENNFLGTAGALCLPEVKCKLDRTFIVSNCDIIINIDFNHFLEYHKNNRNKATILGVIKYIKVPYGVLKIKGNNLDDFAEKPEYNILANSGIYVLEPEVLDLVSENQLINMPDLLMLAIKKGLKVGVYPINSPWFDIGEWEEYKEAADYIKKYTDFR
jgi:NDP-sugar pyrophosphorylase family protein